MGCIKHKMAHNGGTKHGMVVGSRDVPAPPKRSHQANEVQYGSKRRGVSVYAMTEEYEIFTRSIVAACRQVQAGHPAGAKVIQRKGETQYRARS